MNLDIIPIRPDHVDGFHAAVDFVAREGRYLAMTEGNIAKGNPQLLVLDDGRIVGWCDIIRGELSTRVHGGTLGVACGLGQRLMIATLTLAKDRNFRRVALTVNQDNKRAIELYERMGFAHEGVMRGAALIEGAYRDVHMMAIADLGLWATSQGEP